uniref:Uncharacterized protein n=1 Tax=Haemonchus contortus TaxID=6289 RepID=A0A7I4Z4A5_HAECO
PVARLQRPTTALAQNDGQTPRSHRSTRLHHRIKSICVLRVYELLLGSCTYSKKLQTLG